MSRTTTENIANTTPKDNILVYILVPASVIALVGFIILAYLIVRCFREVHNREDAIHLTGKDHAVESEHKLFGLFHTSYSGMNSNEQNAAKEKPRKGSIFELTENHSIPRQEPAYLDIDIPIDISSSDDDKAVRRTKETIFNKKTCLHIEERSIEPIYNHIAINNDDGIYNKITLKCPDQRSTQHVRSTFEDAEYDTSAVVKSYKTFENSYSRLSSVVPRKNPFLRLMEEVDDSYDTSAKRSLNNDTPSDSQKKSSQNKGGNAKQTAEQNKHRFISSKIKNRDGGKPETIDEKETAEEVERSDTDESKCADSNKTYEVSTESLDKNGYSIVSKRKYEIQSNVAEYDEIETKADRDRNIKPRRTDEYSEIEMKTDKKREDFPYDGIEIHTEKFFIITDS